MASLIPSECRICRLPLAQTTTSRRNCCPFCKKTFQRVDGARRHAKTCPLRGGRPLPPEAKRGRKVHACDRCSQFKVICDAKAPCARCTSRGLNCTYERLCADPTHRVRLTAAAQELSSKSSNYLPALSFILGCADPSGSHVDEVILDGEPEHGPANLVTQESLHARATVSDTIDPRLLFLGFIGPSFDATPEYDGMNRGYNQDALDRLHLNTSDDELEGRVGLLAADLERLAAAMPDYETFPSLDLFTTFFKVTNFRDCITAFFHRGHLLASIIHLPTLHLGLLDTTLLLAIALSGSTYLHHRTENLGSTTFILALQGLAEEYIFRRVNQHLCAAVCSASSREVLEVCQAAYLIETLQMFVKDPTVRQRVINKCHHMLVALLRGLDVMGSKHESPYGELDWHLFVRKESWIRIITWTFINDAWLIFFSNHTPALTLSDMRGQLPCSDGLWQIDNPTGFDCLRAQQGFDSTLRSLKDLVSGLLNEGSTESTAAHFGLLDVQHLHVAVLAFQHIIFHYHTSVLVDNTSILLRGLDQWNLLWDHAINQIDNEEQRWLGLVKYSAGIAFISKRMIEASKTEDGMKSKYLQRTVSYNTVALYQFLRQFCINDCY